MWQKYEINFTKKKTIIRSITCREGRKPANSNLLCQMQASHKQNYALLSTHYTLRIALTT